jgi:hypothetical protein
MEAGLSLCEAHVEKARCVALGWDIAVCEAHIAGLQAQWDSVKVGESAEAGSDAALAASIDSLLDVHESVHQDALVWMQLCVSDPATAAAEHPEYELATQDDVDEQQALVNAYMGRTPTTQVLDL